MVIDNYTPSCCESGGLQLIQPGFRQCFGDVDRPTTATVKFTYLTNGGNIYLSGDGGSVDANVNATTFSLDNISGSNGGTGFPPGPYTQGGTGNIDGHGTFNGQVDSFDGFTHSSDMISFDLTNTSGTWASASD